MEDLSAHKDMLRKEALSFQRAFEARLRTTDEWLNHCLLDSGGVCVPPNSLVADLATTTTSSFSSTTAAATITAAERERVLELAHTSRSSRVTNEFDDPASGNASAAVKSTWLFGLPIAGYTSANQAASVQSRAVDSSVIRNGISLKAEALLASAEFRNVACFNACEQGKHEFRVVFDYPRLNPTWATRQLAKDGPLAGFSMLFVLCVMTAHTRSFTIASVGMLQILLSFPTAYFFYRIVCGILHFGTLQVLAVYVILGIGADDIFVLFDAFQQAPTQHGSAYRLSWALRRAVSAMTVTSLTTFAAFLVTALSPITNIKVFGIFASVLVLTNFVLCCLLTPVLITLIHSGRCCCSRRCCCCCLRGDGGGDGGGGCSFGCAPPPAAKSSAATATTTGASDAAASTSSSSSSASPASSATSLRPIERVFNRTIAPLVIRFQWPLVLVFAALLGTFGYLALRLAPSDKGIGDIWPDHHPVAVVNRLKSGPFLKGEARYMRVEVLFGLMDNATVSAWEGGAGISRDGTNPLDPTDKGTVVWNPAFDMADPNAQTAFMCVKAGPNPPCPLLPLAPREPMLALASSTPPPSCRAPASESRASHSKSPRVYYLSITCPSWQVPLRRLGRVRTPLAAQLRLRAQGLADVPRILWPHRLPNPQKRLLGPAGGDARLHVTPRRVGRAGGVDSRGLHDHR